MQKHFLQETIIGLDSHMDLIPDVIRVIKQFLECNLHRRIDREKCIGDDIKPSEDFISLLRMTMNYNPGEFELRKSEEL